MPSARFGIVLAAGQGTRMGGPKALLRVGARTLTELHVERLLEARCKPIVVVTRPELASHLEPLLPAAAVTLGVVTSSPADSLSAAIAWLDQRELGWMDADRSAVVVTPVDLLPASVATIEQLLLAVETSHDVLAASPTLRGQGGHPVVARPSVLRGPAVPLRERLGSLGSRRVRVAVDDAAITGDFDSPADLPPI